MKFQVLQLKIISIIHHQDKMFTGVLISVPSTESKYTHLYALYLIRGSFGNAASKR